MLIQEAFLEKKMEHSMSEGKKDARLEIAWSYKGSRHPFEPSRSISLYNLAQCHKLKLTRRQLNLFPFIYSAFYTILRIDLFARNMKLEFKHKNGDSQIQKYSMRPHGLKPYDIQIVAEYVFEMLHFSPPLIFLDCFFPLFDSYHGY